MINLLAPEDQRQLIAARTNSLLLRYVLLLGLLIVLLAAEMGGAYIVLANEKSRNEAVITENQASTASYSATKTQAAAFASDLSTAKYILNQQVPYTSIILRLAATLPESTVLDKVSIDPATFGTSTTLVAHTSSYQQAIAVKASLQQSKLFSDVNFQSITQGTDKTRPFIATYNVTYTKDILNQL